MEKYSFKKYQPLGLRLWHWLNAMAILGLLGTVLLRKTLLSWRSNSALIEAKMQGAGVAIPPGLAREIAVGIRNPLWDWHVYLGFSLGVLLAFRLLVWFFAERKGSAQPLCKHLLALPKLTPQELPAGLHFGLVKASYAVFYLAAASMALTGAAMHFKAEWSLSKTTVSIIKEYHEAAMWFFIVFAIAHILGVIVAEIRKDKGIVSDMIHGGNRNGG
jgi:cytochrome b561